MSFFAVSKSLVVCIKERAIQSTSNFIASCKSFLSFGVIIFKSSLVSGIFKPLLFEISPPSVTTHLIEVGDFDFTFKRTFPSLTRRRWPTDIDLKISLWGKYTLLLSPS